MPYRRNHHAKPNEAIIMLRDLLSDPRLLPATDHLAARLIITTAMDDLHLPLKPLPE